MPSFLDDEKEMEEGPSSLRGKSEEEEQDQEEEDDEEDVGGDAIDSQDAMELDDASASEEALNMDNGKGPNRLLGENVVHSQNPLPLLDINLKLLPLSSTSAAMSRLEQDQPKKGPCECPWINDDLTTVFDFLTQFKDVLGLPSNMTLEDLHNLVMGRGARGQRAKTQITALLDWVQVRLVEHLRSHINRIMGLGLMVPFPVPPNALNWPELARLLLVAQRVKGLMQLREESGHVTGVERLSNELNVWLWGNRQPKGRTSTIRAVAAKKGRRGRRSAASIAASLQDDEEEEDEEEEEQEENEEEVDGGIKEEKDGNGGAEAKQEDDAIMDVVTANGNTSTAAGEGEGGAAAAAASGAAGTTIPTTKSTKPFRTPDEEVVLAVQRGFLAWCLRYRPKQLMKAKILGGKGEQPSKKSIKKANPPPLVSVSEQRKASPAVGVDGGGGGGSSSAGSNSGGRSSSKRGGGRGRQAPPRKAGKTRSEKEVLKKTTLNTTQDVRKFLKGCDFTDFQWPWSRTLRTVIDVYNPRLIVEGIQKAAKEAGDGPIKNEFKRCLQEEGSCEGALRSKELALKAMARRILKAKREALLGKGGSAAASGGGGGATSSLDGTVVMEKRRGRPSKIALAAAAAQEEKEAAKREAAAAAMEEVKSATERGGGKGVRGNKRKICIGEEEALRRCEALVIYLGTFAETGLFHLPIPAELEAAYRRIIKEPICLRDIHRRVKEGYYPAEEERRRVRKASMSEKQRAKAGKTQQPPHEIFAADMRLVGRNAQIFNQEGSEAWEAARQYLERFQDTYKKWILNPLHGDDSRGPSEMHLTMRPPWFEGCATCKLDGNLDEVELVACDSCNRDFHTACLGEENQPQEKEDWYCGDCKGDAPLPPKLGGKKVSAAFFKTDEGKEEDWREEVEGEEEEDEGEGEVDRSRMTRAQRKKAEEEEAQGPKLKVKDRDLNHYLRAVVRSLAHIPRFHPFYLPLDPELFPDYYEKIDNPMSLQTIDRRIANNVYGMDPDLFAHDVRLVARNAHLYNDGVNQEISTLADDLLANFERLYKAWVLGPMAATSKGPQESDFLLPAPWGEGCSICRGDENDDMIVSCDGCGAEFHCYCVGLKKVPADEWFCHQCGGYEAPSPLPAPRSSSSRPSFIHSNSRKDGSSVSGDDGVEATALSAINDEEEGEGSGNDDSSSMEQEKKGPVKEYVDEVVERLAKTEGVALDLLGTQVLKAFPAGEGEGGGGGGGGVCEGVVVDVTEEYGYKCSYPAEGREESLYEEELAWVLKETVKFTNQPLEEMEKKPEGYVEGEAPLTSMEGGFERCTEVAIQRLHSTSYWHLSPEERLAILRALCEAAVSTTSFREAIYAFQVASGQIDTNNLTGENGEKIEVVGADKGEAAAAVAAGGGEGADQKKKKKGGSGAAAAAAAAGEGGGAAKDNKDAAGKRIRNRKKKEEVEEIIPAELALLPRTTWNRPDENGRQYLAFCGHSHGHIFEREEKGDKEVHWHMFDVSMGEDQDAFDERIEPVKDKEQLLMMLDAHSQEPLLVHDVEGEQEGGEEKKLSTCSTMAGYANNAFVEGICEVCVGECQFWLPSNPHLFSMARRRSGLDAFVDHLGGISAGLLALASFIPPKIIAKGILTDPTIYSLWRVFVESVTKERQLMQALLILERCISPLNLSPWWIKSSLFRNPGRATRGVTLQSVAYRLYLLKTALRVGATSTASSSTTASFMPPGGEDGF